MIVLLIWAVLATSVAVKYYSEYAQLSRACSSLSTKVILVNVGIDYGNGTVAWYNATPLPIGASVLTALVSVAKVEYKYGTYGAYVVSVNGVCEQILSKTEGYSWMWYIYNASLGRYVLGPVAADKYVLTNGDTILWKYQHWSFPGGG